MSIDTIYISFNNNHNYQFLSKVPFFSYVFYLIFVAGNEERWMDLL